MLQCNPALKGPLHRGGSPSRGETPGVQSARPLGGRTKAEIAWRNLTWGCTCRPKFIVQLLGEGGVSMSTPITFQRSGFLEKEFEKKNPRPYFASITVLKTPSLRVSESTLTPLYAWSGYLGQVL